MPTGQDLIARGLGASFADLGIFRDSEYQVYVRHPNMSRMGLLTSFLRLELTILFNGVGAWTLETNAEDIELDTFYDTGGIIVTRTVNGRTRVIFSGSVSTEYAFTSTTFRAAGLSDEAILRGAAARPTPAEDGPNFTDAFDVRTGQASTIIRSLVDVNIGPSAPAKWRIPQITLAADPLIGSTITSRARLDTLLTLLKQLCLTPIAGGLGFYLRQSNDLSNAIEFGVYAPRDRREEVKFTTELNSAQDYEDIKVMPEYNHVYVMGGDGFGTSRTIVEAEDADSIAALGRRISTVINKFGVDDLGELNQAAAEAIASAMISQKTTIQTFETLSLQWGVHYELGDLVTIVTHAGEHTDIIRGIQLTLDRQQGNRVTPIVGQGDDTFESSVAQHIASVEDRVGNIERNWTVPDDSIIESMLHPTMKWLPGDMKQTARASAQEGWLICDGTAISRAVYSRLFSSIGTLYGVGDGVNTFNIPDFRGRMPIGVGDGYILGEVGGADTLDVDFGLHSHEHSHGGGDLVFTHTHASQAHTHPGSHSHGIEAHRHPHTHAHPFAITGLETGRRNNDTVGAFGFDEPNVSSGTEDHHHNVNIYNSNTDNASPTNTSDGVQSDGGGNFDSTEPDSNAYAASYTGSPSGPSGGSWTGGTDPDDNEAGVSATGLDIKNKYQCINFEIYTGVGL